VMDAIIDFVSHEAKSSREMVAAMVTVCEGWKLDITIEYGLQYAPTFSTFICGNSSRTRKSTSFGMIKTIFGIEAYKIGSVQALMRDLKKDPRRFAYHDEASGLLKQMSSDVRGEKRLGETLNEIITNPVGQSIVEESTLAARERYVTTPRLGGVEETTDENGNVIPAADPSMNVNDPHLSLVMCTTPKSISFVTSEELLHGGFFYRCLIVKPEPIVLGESDELDWNSGTRARLARITELADEIAAIPDHKWFVTVPRDVMLTILHGLTIGDDDDDMESYRTHIKTMTVKAAAVRCVDRHIMSGSYPRAGESFEISIDDASWALQMITRPAMRAFRSLFKHAIDNKMYSRLLNFIDASTDEILKCRGPGKTIKASLRMTEKEHFSDLLSDAAEFFGYPIVTIPNANNAPVEYICKRDDCHECEMRGCSKRGVRDE